MDESGPLRAYRSTIFMKPEIVDQDEYTATLKMPTGDRIKISRATLPKFLAELEFAILQQGSAH